MKVPTDEWTVEELLEWMYLHSQSKIRLATNKLIDELGQTYEKAEEDIWMLHSLAEKVDTDNRNSLIECHELVRKGIEDDANDLSNDGVNIVRPNDTNDTEDGCVEEQLGVIEKSKKKIIKPKFNNNLHVEVLSGPHEGECFLIKPRMNRTCEIGRSKGKKFRERGISLYRDSEVSTSHGKFEMKAGGKICYIDTGSTNGTSFQGEALEDNEPLLLMDGMCLCFGESNLRFTIITA